MKKCFDPIGSILQLRVSYHEIFRTMSINQLLLPVTMEHILYVAVFLEMCYFAVIIFGVL